MRRPLAFALCLALLLLASACHRKPSHAPVPSLPSIAIDEVPAPANPTVALPRGSNLQAIASTAYGHEDFSEFIARLNGITDPRRIAAGATLKTPSLAVALRDAGLDPAYQPAVNALAHTWMQLRTTLRDYGRERDAAHARDGDNFTITPELSRRLMKHAETTDAALAVLSHPQPGHKFPRSTIGKFTSASAAVRRFAAGRVESGDYDIFLCGKDFGLGFTYLLIWAQSGYQ